MRTAGWLLGMMVCVGSAGGQGAASVLPATANAVLREMGSQAAIIFAGRVEAVLRADDLGYVDVRFRVESGVRGAQTGGVYVLREWAGLWTGGAVRYTVGQRRLMLLAGRGPSGMSAPVSGMDGAVPLFGDADGTTRVDLRWVRARAWRGVVASAGSVGAAAAEGQAHADPFNDDWAGPVAAMAAGGPGAGVQEPSLDEVIAMLGGAGV